jgi:hypothetical protein
MPDLNPNGAVEGGAAKPSESEAAAEADTRNTESFEAHDARLAAELKRYGQARAGSRGFEFGHDESYQPGYHDGGVRFGFFNEKDALKPVDPTKIDPKADGKV